MSAIRQMAVTGQRNAHCHTASAPALAKPEGLPELAGVAGKLERQHLAVLQAQQRHGAALPGWVREEEAAGHLVLFVERGPRLMCYVHDPAAVEDDDE